MRGLVSREKEKKEARVRETKVWSCPLSTRLDDIVKKFKWSPKHIFSQIMMQEFL